jgi:hypothetical protein
MHTVHDTEVDAAVFLIEVGARRARLVSLERAPIARINRDRDVVAARPGVDVVSTGARHPYAGAKRRSDAT